MTDPIEPLVPPDVDLRDFAYMPLDVVRLRDSDIAGIEDGEVFRAAVLAWCAAWHQVPAGSLPDDDALLARLTGYGRDVATWRRLREAGALRGFVLCSDGRLYHGVVCAKALEAWDKKRTQRAKTRAATLAAQKARRRDEDRDVSVTDTVTDTVTESKGREGKGTEPRMEVNLPCNSEQPPGPDKPGARAERADRGTRLPADWSPSDEDRAFAEGEGIDPEREAGSFRDYWTSKPGAAGRKSNWSATWRNWVRRSAERKPSNAEQPRYRNGFIALAEKRAREDRERAAGGTVIDLIPDDGRSETRDRWR